MALGDADLPAMLAELGVDVVLQVTGQPTTKGIVDQFHEELFDSPGPSEITGRSVVVTIRTNSLPGMAPGSFIVVDGTIHRVRQLRQVDDGALTRIHAVHEA